MKLIYSKFLAHPNTVEGSYDYKYIEGQPSSYGKSTRFSFKHCINDEDDFLKALLEPNRAWSCALVGKGDKFRNSNQYNYIFKTDNILTINGCMSIDLDDITQDEIDNTLNKLKDKQVEFYALHSQNSNVNQLKIKLLVNTGLHFISEQGINYLSDYIDLGEEDDSFEAKLSMLNSKRTTVLTKLKELRELNEHTELSEKDTYLLKALEDVVEVYEPNYTYFPLSKYKSAYYAFADSIGVSIQMDTSSADAARLIAPFHDPHKQSKPKMYDYNRPSSDNPFTVYDFNSEIDISELEDYIKPNTTTSSELVADLDNLTKTFTLTLTDDKLKHYPDTYTNQTQDYSKSIKYLIDISINNTHKRVTLLEAAVLKAKGYTFQVSCLCNTIHEHGHISKTNVGYGILSDNGQGKFHITCSSPNHSPKKTVHFDIIDPLHITPQEAVNLDKYTKLTNKKFISNDNGKFITLKHKLQFSKELEDLTKGLIRWGDVTRGCDLVVYYVEEDKFKLSSTHTELNSRDYISSRDILLILQGLGCVWSDKITDGKKSYYPFDKRELEVTILHFIKHNCLRVDRIVYKISNLYKDSRNEYKDNKLIKYRPFNPIKVPQQEPHNSILAFNHFTQIHTELKYILKQLVVLSFQEPASKTGERFYFYFGTGGIGKGIINQALLSCGAGTPLSASTFYTIGGGTAEDVKISESTTALNTHMIAILSDASQPKKLLSKAKNFTDIFLARNNYKNAEEVSINSLAIFAADNINPKEFFNGADAGQVLRRFKVPQVVQPNKPLILRKPDYIQSKDWYEGSPEMFNYVKGVEYQIAYTLHNLIAKCKEDIYYMNELQEELVKFPMRETIDRNIATENKHKIAAQALIDFISYIVQNSKPTIDNIHTSRSNKKPIKVAEVNPRLNKSVGITTKGKFVLASKVFNIYAEIIEDSLYDNSGFVYSTQQNYIVELCEAVDNSVGRSSANVRNSSSNTSKVNYSYEAPFDAYIYLSIQNEEGEYYDKFKDTQIYNSKDPDELYDKLVELISNSNIKFKTKTILISSILAQYHKLEQEDTSIAHSIEEDEDQDLDDAFSLVS